MATFLLNIRANRVPPAEIESWLQHFVEKMIGQGLKQSFGLVVEPPAGYILDPVLEFVFWDQFVESHPGVDHLLYLDLQILNKMILGVLSEKEFFRHLESQLQPT